MHAQVHRLLIFFCWFKKNWHYHMPKKDVNGVEAHTAAYPRIQNGHQANAQGKSPQIVMVTLICDKNICILTLNVLHLRKTCLSWCKRKVSECKIIKKFLKCWEIIFKNIKSSLYECQTKQFPTTWYGIYTAKKAGICPSQSLYSQLLEV